MLGANDTLPKPLVSAIISSSSSMLTLSWCCCVPVVGVLSILVAVEVVDDTLSLELFTETCATAVGIGIVVTTLNAEASDSRRDWGSANDEDDDDDESAGVVTVVVAAVVVPPLISLHPSPSL